MASLPSQIQDLLHASIRAHDIRENDAVSLKTLKLTLVSRVMECLGLDWSYLMNLFKTCTPIHPEMVKELRQLGDEEATSTLAQIFVRNEKLIRLAKVLTQHGKNLDGILAVDGLGGNLANGANFDQKHYITNLRYGNKNDPKIFFDNDPECKRLHVQTVRELYKKLEHVPVPEKQIYEILRYTFMELAKVNLPELELTEEEIMDRTLQKECYEFYTSTMGKENIENFIKSLKKFRGEKRALAEREDETAAPNEKLLKSVVKQI